MTRQCTREIVNFIKTEENFNDFDDHEFKDAVKNLVEQVKEFHKICIDEIDTIHEPSTNNKSKK